MTQKESVSNSKRKICLYFSPSGPAENRFHTVDIGGNIHCPAVSFYEQAVRCRCGLTRYTDHRRRGTNDACPSDIVIILIPPDILPQPAERDRQGKRGPTLSGFNDILSGIFLKTSFVLLTFHAVTKSIFLKSSRKLNISFGSMSGICRSSIRRFPISYPVFCPLQSSSICTPKASISYK